MKDRPSVAARRIVFGRVTGGRVQLRSFDGSPIRGPLGRGTRLVISRSDCDVVCLRVPRGSPRQMRKRLERELPAAYPGALDGLVYDFVPQPVEGGFVLLVVLLRAETFALYAAAAGRAGLTILSRLFASSRRARPPSRLPREAVIAQGRSKELLTVVRGAVLASHFLPPAAPSKGSTPRPPGGPPVIDLARLHPRPKDNDRLFEAQRGVHAWMRSVFLSPLFLSLALPLILGANIMTARLIADRTAAIEELRVAAAGVALAAEARRSTGERANALRLRVRALEQMLPRDLYAALAELHRALGDEAVVRQASFTGKSADLLLRSPNPVDTLRRIEGIDGVKSVEIAATEPVASDGVARMTVRIVYQ